jgi:hypothetical protein
MSDEEASDGDVVIQQGDNRLPQNGVDGEGGVRRTFKAYVEDWEQPCVERLANRTGTVRDLLRLTRKYGGLTWIDVRRHPDGIDEEPVRIVTLSMGCRVTERGEFAIPVADEFEQKYFLSRETIFERMTQPLRQTTVQVVRPPNQGNVVKDYTLPVRFLRSKEFTDFDVDEHRGPDDTPEQIS